MSPTALLFDVFGTVVDWRRSLVAELTTFGAARAISADWAAFVDAWRGEYGPAMDRVRRGESPWAPLDDLHRGALDHLIATFGLPDLSEADRRSLNLGWHRLDPWPDSVPGLTRLKRRYTIGTLSNGNVALLVDMARHGGLPWDVVFASDLFGHFKPDPDVYLGACAFLDLPPGEVMLAAAHNRDLGAAAELGLRTAFVARPTEYGPNQDKDLKATGPWDVVATDIEDLAAQLGV